MNDFTPRLVCFSCNFGWGYLAERERLSSSIKNWVPVVCSGKIDAVHVIKAFKEGADGVMILGCPEGECHFQDGNYQVKKRMALLKKVLSSHGIEPERVMMSFSLDPEGNSLPGLVQEMRERIGKIGPIRI